MNFWKGITVGLAIAIEISVFYQVFFGLLVPNGQSYPALKALLYTVPIGSLVGVMMVSYPQKKNDEGAEFWSGIAWFGSTLIGFPACYLMVLSFAFGPLAIAIFLSVTSIVITVILYLFWLRSKLRL